MYVRTISPFKNSSYLSIPFQNVGMLAGILLVLETGLNSHEPVSPSLRDFSTSVE
jgi:hypothetical protein